MIVARLRVIEAEEAADGDSARDEVVQRWSELNRERAVSVADRSVANTERRIARDRELAAFAESFGWTVARLSIDALPVHRVVSAALRISAALRMSHIRGCEDYE